MNSLSSALVFTLKWEGGYVNNPNDPGGETNKGITKSVYDAYRKDRKSPIQSVKLISDDEVFAIYSQQYWCCAGCDKISDVKLAISVFDFAVNGGVSRAIRYLALCNNDYKKYIELRIAYYNKIVAVNPKLKVFLKGWLNRTTSLLTYLKSIH
ncbi:MAG: hypothetical protein M0R17_00195 [Candidatus Omnitrophica bacterium]|jgi:lysozyme family protein|nr:hypothetical protein [Candidatus Omnitrophota bacterium]